MSAPIVRAEHVAFGGRQGFYEHQSAAIGGPMRVAVFMPPGAHAQARVPAVYVLAGLTCTEETFAIKAGAQRIAAELGLAIVTCDTSPRHVRFPGDDEHWDFGRGAGFYLDATQAPWSSAYKMESYVVHELPAWVEGSFAVRDDVRGICGHSMGGHGALTLAMRHPDRYASVSAFAPIAAPSRVPWGQKAFERYLGTDRAAWVEHDTVELLAAGRRLPGTPLVDQGTDDVFVTEQLRPELLEEACAAAGQPLCLRRHDGYDHSYWFIATFVADHMRHHAAAFGSLNRT